MDRMRRHRLSPGHGFALLASAALVLVSAGSRVPGAAVAPPDPAADGAAALLVALALVAACVLVLPRSARARAAGGAAVFLVALGFAATTGHLAASLASVAGLLASLVGLPRRDPWRGAYF